jgi:hypothetical protein
LASTSDDTNWLDGPAPVVEDDDWLKIEDPNANRVPSQFHMLIEACMPGTERRMCSWGNYLAYRPYNPRTDKEVNPRTKERFSMFIAAGEVKHLGTYDDVQIWEFQKGSPYYHDGNKAYVVGQNYWGDIRQVATLACERKWAEYHDFLEGMAKAMKGGNRDPAFAKTMWQDALNQIAVAIKQMNGPEEREVNEGFIGVRAKRGIARGGILATLNSSGLQKVEFSGR